MPMPASGYHTPGSVHKDDERAHPGGLRPNLPAMGW
ncbi:hypothetical protein ABIB82_005119 [Bradyrhizobium sp. i1.8.4]